MNEENGHLEHLQIPTNNDLEEIRKLLQHEALLVEQLIQTREILKDAWKKLPYDPDIEKKPWRSDIHATCRRCGKPTKWRTPKGHSQHYIKKGDDLILECPPDRRGHTTPGISDDLWAIIDAPDEDFADLNDDEIVEIIQGKSLEEVKNKKDEPEKKPSEREN